MNALTQAREANETYHARPELSSSQIADFMDDPVRWYRTYVAGEITKETTPAMQFGNEVHLMLETWRYEEKKYVRIPSDVLGKGERKSGNAWKEFEASHPAGTLFLKPSEPKPEDALKEIWANVLANSDCCAFVQAGEKEKEVFWTDPQTGIECKAKADIWCEETLTIWDWKTTRSVDRWGFKRECEKRHYFDRLAFYRRGFAKLMDVPEQRISIIAGAIENANSYRVFPYEINAYLIEKADKVLSKTLARIKGFEFDAYMDQTTSLLIEEK